MTPLLVYAAAAIVFTWPLVLHPTIHLAAPAGLGDPFLNLWILGWGMQTTVDDPTRILTGRVFDANIFHPAEGTLAFSDHLLLQAVVMAPLYAVTGDVVLCYNVLLVLSLFASAAAMHAFVREVTGSTGGAYLAGLAWAFWPYRFAHLVHLQLQSLYFLPLAFLLLHRVMAGRRWRDAAGLGAVAGLQAISSVYYGVIGAIGLASGAIALAVGVGRWRSSVVARRLLLAGLVGAVVVMPVVLPYWRVQQNEGFGRNLYEASRNAAHAGSYAQVPPANLVYGRTGLLPAQGPERELFPGFVVVCLALVGVVLGWRGDARPTVLTMGVVGSLGFVLSLGPEGVRDVYAALQRFVFGFQAIRAPARFAVLVMFALTTLAAIGWRELANSHIRKSQTPNGRAAALGALIVVAAVEYLNIPVPLTAAPPRETSIGQWLKREPGSGSVIHLPLALDIESTPAMVQSLEHRRPIVNGYSGQRPAFYAPLVDTLSTFPSDEALLALDEIGIQFVVTRAPIARPTAEAPWPFVERARFDEGVIYEFRWSPELDERISAAVTVTPPPPGPAPFASGETARYIVRWSGAAMDVPAGDVTIAVQEPGRTFLVTAATAPWVARFYEARDRFLTRADPQLLPQLHEREQREGARTVTRAFVYDHAGGVIRLGRSPEHAASEEGVALPLHPSSRDAISALFYARTLPLEQGARYSIPVNEAGRNLLVDLVVGGREAIQAEGATVDAIRIEPRIRRRVERRQPLTATLWLSVDERRVPLALDLDAGFGRVRAELVSYRRGKP
jgi:hypothetical protein